MGATSPTRLGLIIAIAAVALLALILVPRVMRRSASPAQAAPSELTRQEGRLFLLGKDRPFTGLLVESYPDGSIRSRSALVEGLLHGVSEGYYTNGQLEVQEEFRHGVAHGIRTKYHPNGNIKSQGAILDGQIDGIYRCWNDHGFLESEVEMRRGQVHGLSRAYYPSGCLRTLARLEDGQILEQQSWADGERKP